MALLERYDLPSLVIFIQSIVFLLSQAERREELSESEKEEADEGRESEEDLLVFDDSILGTSITVSNSGLRAARDEASFCNGVIFSKVEMIVKFSD